MLAERIRAQRGRALRDDVAGDVEQITGHRPNLDEFLSAEATDQMAERAVAAARDPSVQRRVWSTALAAEVEATVLADAERFTGQTAYWLHHSSSVVGAVEIPLDVLLRHVAVTFTAGDHDVVLVTAQGESGLRLAWDHLSAGDEYELVHWGKYRV